MLYKKLFLGLAFIFVASFNSVVQAENPASNAFSFGSYQKILAENTNHPFMLVIWSIDCAYCLEEMSLLSEIHKNRPEFKMIFLATDDLSETDQIQQILKEHQLSSTDHWVFSEENTQRLRFEIDPTWYGELPRTYFFDKAHQRTGISGLLSRENYEEIVATLVK